MSSDFYPNNREAVAAWHANLAANIGSVKTKYGITVSVQTQVAEDNAWIQFWVAYRNAFDASSQQLTKYYNTIAGGSEQPETPLPFTIAAPVDPPAEVPPGIEKRARDLASFIKGNKAVYSEADGELLGIVAGEEIKGSLGDMTASFTLTTQAEFKLKADFKKNGMDGIRFEYRHIGGAWNPAGVLLTSGGKFTVPPTTPGVGQQVEIRGIYIKGNDDVGNFSPAVAAFIAP
ncbi:MAG: hypothetical protein WBC19_10335 [Pyrinomonadaceae bacterium]